MPVTLIAIGRYEVTNPDASGTGGAAFHAAWPPGESDAWFLPRWHSWVQRGRSAAGADDD